MLIVSPTTHTTSSEGNCSVNPGPTSFALPAVKPNMDLPYEGKYCDMEYINGSVAAEGVHQERTLLEWGP